jgi:hypothetical protein
MYHTRVHFAHIPTAPTQRVGNGLERVGARSKLQKEVQRVAVSPKAARLRLLRAEAE